METKKITVLIIWSGTLKIFRNSCF